MSFGLLLAATAGLLLAPRAMLPRESGRQEPEVRGLLAWLWWVNAAYCAAWHRLRVDGPAPLPEAGAAILIANHTSAIDHFLLQAGCRRVLGFLVAREYYDNRLFHPICVILGCIPVKRDGHDLGATRAAVRALQEGRVVPIFPEGRITPESGHVLGEGLPGAAFIALKGRVPVIPAYIRGTPRSNEFWACVRTPSRSRVVFGPPIEMADLYASTSTERELKAVALGRLMDAIRALKDRVEAEDADG